MIPQFQSSYSIQELNSSGSTEGEAYTFCGISDSFTQQAMATIEKIGTCSDADANGNPVPNVAVIPGAPKFQLTGVFASSEDTTLTNPPQWTVGTPVLLTLDLGNLYTFRARITSIGDSATENNIREWTFGFVATSKVVIADRT
jgi:hypothetical protein